MTVDKRYSLFCFGGVYEERSFKMLRPDDGQLHVHELKRLAGPVPML
jgi:hypothetical protein